MKTRLSYLAPPLNLTAMKLKKLELSAHRGFSDHDLGKLVSSLPCLQWVDFSFAFVFVDTLEALGTACAGLLYLRLCRYPPPPARNTSSIASRSISSSSGGGGGGGNLGRESPASTGVMETAANTNAGNNIPNNHTNQATNNLINAVNQALEDERLTNVQWEAVNRTATIPDLIRTPPSGSAALIKFASHHGKKLRVLDLSGATGLNDSVLQGLCQLKSVHTLFIEQCHVITGDGLVQFCEGKWKEIRRVYLRNCRGAKLSVVQWNYLGRGLEVEVVVDGRSGGSNSGGGGGGGGTVVGL
ncbi:hypothetical protein SeLEV6574_g07727 [Synchytrium endobioticum]|uniref:Uncharacterized protein n=1 Tax=Synchytrium endobioticum TaxID=286115 RepID=A0A507CGR6_9FUNG|nr:hypothetical protein SeLEV6574_g07727 [Synchytrium endobioticum]